MESTILGVSIKSIFLIGGVIVFGGVVYYLLTSNNKKQKNKPINKLLSDDNRYIGDKSIIEDAIKEKDWELLEDMLKSSTADFPDLIIIIKNALKNR